MSFYGSHSHPPKRGWATKGNFFFGRGFWVYWSIKRCVGGNIFNTNRSAYWIICTHCSVFVSSVWPKLVLPSFLYQISMECLWHCWDVQEVQLSLGMAFSSCKCLHLVSHLSLQILHRYLWLCGQVSCAGKIYDFPNRRFCASSLFLQVLKASFSEYTLSVHPTFPFSLTQARYFIYFFSCALTYGVLQF